MSWRMFVVFGVMIGLDASTGPRIPAMRRLNVVALDAKGRPVTDVTASDLQVFEDGKAEPISYFRFSGAQTSRPAADGFSNRDAQQRKTTVILLDLISDRLLSDAVIGRQVAEALKSIESGEDVYLYLLTNVGALYPVRGLPEPGTVAEAADAWTQNAGPMIDAALRKVSSLRPENDKDLQIRFDLTAAAVRKLGGQMQDVRGRKNLVWITHGVPLVGMSISRTRLDFTQKVKFLGGQLEQAQIAVYAVQQSIEGSAEDVGTYESETLELFAGLTGGRFYASHRAAQAIAEARTDARANYQLAYESTVLPDGKDHKLWLKCSRKDVRLTTEKSFMASPAPLEFERRAFETAGESPLDAGEIGLQVSAAKSANGTRFDLKIETADLMLREIQGRHAGQVSVLFAAYKDGKMTQASEPIPLDVRLTGEQYEKARDGSLEFFETIPVAPGVQQIRAIVVDRDRRAVGSVTIPAVN